jgi:hypothetical protein
MRYLENFVNYLNESVEDITDLSKEELDGLLIPITDLGIEYSLTEPRTITEGEFSGYKSMNINFRNSFKLGPSGGYTEQIIDDNYVQVSTLCFIDKKKDPKELALELMKPFNDNKILVNNIKKLCRTIEIDFNDFWKNIIYKIDKQRREDDNNESLLDIFNNNTELVKNIINENYPTLTEKIIIELEKQINNKVFKIQSKINIITKKDINNTIKLIDFLKSQNSWLDSIKYDSGSNYIFESSSEVSNENNHNELFNFLKNNSIKYDVEVRRI